MNQIISNKLSDSRYHEKMYENDITKWAESLMRKKLKHDIIYMMEMTVDKAEGVIIYAVRGSGRTFGNIVTDLNNEIIRIVFDSAIIEEDWREIMKQYIGCELVIK